MLPKLYLIFAGMRGSTPLDVAAASCIDNNELALALQEQDLEMVKYILTCLKRPYCCHADFVPILNALARSQVVKYLAGCGLQSCPMLLAKGYPDIGWNPCGGEKYLDFLRFAVFVNGLSFVLMQRLNPTVLIIVNSQLLLFSLLQERV